MSAHLNPVDPVSNLPKARLVRGLYPDIEIQISIHYRFDVEANGWYRGYNFSDLVHLGQPCPTLW